MPTICNLCSKRPLTKAEIKARYKRCTDCRRKTAARNRRWRATESGRQLNRKRNRLLKQSPEYKAKRKELRARWLLTPAGESYLARHRERMRQRYHERKRAEASNGR